MSNTTTDPRFECLVAFMRGETVRVGEYRFQPLRSGKVAVFTAGQFVPEMTDWFGAALRCGNLMRQAAVWG